MAKNTRANTPAPRPVNAKPARESDASIRARGITPFLRPEHVTSGDVLKLTGFNSVRDRDTDREQIMCEVENDRGDSFTLGVRNGSPDHRILHRAFGADHKRWVGSVGVKVVPGRQAGTSFVNVAHASAEPPVWDGGAPPPSDDDYASEGALEG